MPQGIPVKLEDVLTCPSIYQSFKLKNLLFKHKLKEKRCENCNSVQWLNKPIPLELEHINGNKNDNRLENLKIVCPNCHALTDTYRGKNKAKKHVGKWTKFFA